MSPTRRSSDSTPDTAVEERPLVGRRADGHGQDGAGPVQADEARVERPRRGADDLGQPGAGLDRVRQGVQSGEIEAGRQALRRGGHGRILGNDERPPSLLGPKCYTP